MFRPTTPAPKTEKKHRTNETTPAAGHMVKHRELIEMIGLNHWGLSHRRVWNLLLANAWGDRLDDPRSDFEIELRELRGAHDSNDRLRDILDTLQKTVVSSRCNGRTLKVQMLGMTDIDDDDRDTGILKYDFPKALVRLLRSSTMYAQLNTKILGSFKSRYSIALYEVIAARVNLQKSSEEITIEQFREWLGVPVGKLLDWYDFNRYAIEPALREVNALAPFAVALKPIKRGKKIERVRLDWSSKAPMSPEERAAVAEANRHSLGRGARIAGTVERVSVDLPADAIARGWDLAGGRALPVDKYGLADEYREWAETLPTPPDNPAAHFFDYCRRRKKQG